MVSDHILVVGDVGVSNVSRGDQKKKEAGHMFEKIPLRAGAANRNTVAARIISCTLRTLRWRTLGRGRIVSDVSSESWCPSKHWVQCFFCYHKQLVGGSGKSVPLKEIGSRWLLRRASDSTFWMFCICQRTQKLYRILK